MEASPNMKVELLDEKEKITKKRILLKKDVKEVRKILFPVNKSRRVKINSLKMNLYWNLENLGKGKKEKSKENVEKFIKKLKSGLEKGTLRKISY